MSSFLEAIENITPEIYQNLKLAVEIGKWPDGRKLTQEQKELTLQAGKPTICRKKSASVIWARRSAAANPRLSPICCSSPRIPCTDE